MKKARKVTSVLLVMSLTVSLLAGCGGKAESYRTIAVSEANGTTVITRSEKDTFDAYEGVHLLSGDDARVNPSADMTLELDNDKHVFADENTHFYITAEGKENSTKSVIKLDEGSVLVSIDNKLSAEETFEVDTPNSTMSVRGTVFFVSVERSGQNQVYTTVQTYEGCVYVGIKDENGKLTDVGLEVNAGEQTEIITDENGVSGYTDIEPAVTRYLSEKTKAKLQKYVKSGIDLSDAGPTFAEGSLDSYERMMEIRSHWKYVCGYDVNDMEKYTFDENGLVIRMQNGTPDENWYSYTNYEYGTNHELLYEESYSMYKSDYDVTLSENFTKIWYNPDGTVAKRNQDDQDMDVYMYYPDGTLKREEHYVNPVKFFEDTQYADELQFFSSSDYNEKGDEIFTQTYSFMYNFVNDRTLYEERYSYEYDSEGRMLVAVSDFDTTYYEYDDFGNLVHSYCISNETGEKLFRDEETNVYEYENGKIKSVTYRRTYNEEGNILCTGVDYYDEHERRISGYEDTVYVDGDGNPWEDGYTEHFEFTFGYDEYGNSTTTIYSFGDGYGNEEWHYTYDNPMFPEGKPGDLFTMTRTVEEVASDGSYFDTYVQIYRYE